MKTDLHQAGQAMLGSSLLEDLHDHQILVDLLLDRSEEGGHLVLPGGDLAVAGGDRDAGNTSYLVT